MNNTIAIIINASSGANETETVVASLREAFAAHSLEPELFLVHPGNSISEVVQKALSGDFKIIVAAGGDGTINAVASELLNTQAILGILPLGTFNHLAGDLKIPLNLEGAVEVLAKGNTKKIDVASVNDHIFLNNSSVGLYSKLVSFREGYQKSGWSKRIALLQAVFDIVFKYSFLNVEIEVNGERELHKTPLVFVGNNQYEVDGFNFGSRATLTGGKICVYTIEHRSRFDLIKLGFHALTKKLSDHEQFNSYVASEVTLETRKDLLRVAVDGEIISLTSPLKYKIEEQALTVVAP